MQNSKIGHIILKGGTIEDLQKEFPDFPSENISEYLINLGYAKSTAQTYSSILNSNVTKKENKVTKSMSSKKSKQAPPTANTGLNPDIAEEVQQSKASKSTLSHSEHADFDNILVDTCALAYEDCLEVIENAKRVTFIFSTLEEMDKKDQQSLNKILRKSGIVPTDSQLKFLAYNIRKYTSEILSNSDKFMLSRFSGYPGTSYPDNKLLQYLSILPVQIRPTLLTSDKNLTAKAKSMDLNYIGKISFCSATQVLVKDFGLGVRIYKIGNTLYANYAGTIQMEIVHNGDTIIYHRNDMTPVVPGDLIYFYDKCKGAITKRTFRV